MAYKELAVEHERVRSELALSKLDISDIYAFVQAHQTIEKNALKELVQGIVYEAIHEHRLHFSEKELEHFQKLLHLVELNSRPQTILTSLLLSVMLRKHRETL